MCSTSRIVCAGFVWLIGLWGISLPDAAALNVIFEPLSETTHPWIVDGTFSFDEENPLFDSDAGGLRNVLEHTANVFEDVFEDPTTIRITYWWDTDMTFCCGQSIPNLMREDANGDLTHSIVRFNPSVPYYIDPTPENDSEYMMDQVLYSFGGNTLTPAQQTARFTGNVPAVFEAGYNGAVVSGGPADGGLRDLLTLAFQEVGHSLGMNAGYSGVTNGNGTGEVDDGDYDVNPNLVNGAVMAMMPRGGTQDPLDHLLGNDAVMGNLSIASERTRPSTADFFAIAATQGWTQLDLPRKDFLAGSDWHNDSNWLGGLRPLSLDEAYVRHGGNVSLSAVGNVRTLVVDNGSAVETGIQSLFADAVTIQDSVGGGTSRIHVESFGDMYSETVTVDDGARLQLTNGFVEVDRLNILSGGELRGHGIVDLPDILSVLRNDGVIRATGDNLLSISSENNLALDLDGEGELGEVIATAGNIDFQTGFAEAFNGEMTIGAGREITLGSGGSIGAGGLVLLNGTANAAAQLDGSILFVNNNGVVRGDGLGIVQNVAIVGEGAFVETADANSELRLNGVTYLSGGRLLGTGLIRQNGEVFVGQDTEASVAVYDMDGQSDDTEFTISAGSTLAITSSAIETGPDNDFDGTLNVNASTLEITPDWRLDGTLNLNGTVEQGGGHAEHGGSDEGDGIASLHGPGEVTVDEGGRINITGETFVETAAAVNNGLVFVDGVGEFSGPSIFGVNADIEINNANDSLRLRDSTTFVGPSIVGSGRLVLEDQVNVAFFDTTVGTAETDLDGLEGNTEILINSDLTFSIASSTTEPEPNDGFDGVITNRGTFSVLAGWRLDGQLTMDQLGSSTPALAGAGPFRIHTTGTFMTDGDALVTAPTEVAGSMFLDNGVTTIDNTAAFESTANVTVQADAELLLNGATSFAGGSYSGGGLIQFNAATEIDADTTMNVARVDLDGNTENAQLTLNDAALTLNVDGVDRTNNIVAGTIDVTGSAARLEINLTQSPLSWRQSSSAVLNFSTGASLPVTMLAGSPALLEGTTNATGRVRLAANIALHGRLETMDASTDVHFGGNGQHLVFNTAQLAGTGAMTIDEGARMHLEDSSNIGIDVENAGHLEVGFHATEVGLELSAPGEAFIRGNFAQTLSGEFFVELAGLMQGSEYDLLTVSETARLGGRLDVALIEDFLPDVDDVFTVLEAGEIVSSFDNAMSGERIPTAEGLGSFLVHYGSGSPFNENHVVLTDFEFSPSADFDQDGDVDGDDLLLWTGDYGLNADSDADADGDSDGADFLAWQRQFGIGVPSPARVAVPEPASIVGAVMMALVALSARRRRI